MESCVVELDGLHRQLRASSTAPGQAHRSVSLLCTVYWSKVGASPFTSGPLHLLQEEPACLAEVVSTLNLLKNLLYSSEEAKVK